MNNQRGLTLIELLATIGIISIIFLLLSGILIDGNKAYRNTTTSQLVQQEANYITEEVRKEYLKQYVPIKMNKTIKFEVKDNTLEMDGKVISKGYTYTILDIPRGNNPANFFLLIERGGLSYTVQTKFSKLE